jgi:hypothetical protein
MRRSWVSLEVLERELLADLEAIQRSLAERGMLLTDKPHPLGASRRFRAD